jgi:hypothetical protein
MNKIIFPSQCLGAGKIFKANVKRFINDFAFRNPFIPSNVIQP